MGCNQFIRFLTETSVGSIPTVGVSRVYTTGTTYYVDSNNGASTNGGLTPDAAVDAISTALALCTANKGDVILCMPGHAETITASMGITVEGVSIRGLGVGDNRPTITTGTSTDADWTITADNVSIDNVIFVNGIDNQTNMIESQKAYTIITNCEFRDGGSSQCLEYINFSNANCDHCKVLGCRFVAPDDGGDNAITIGAALDDLEIAYCYIHGDWDDAGIHNPTGNVATRLLIHDNVVANVASGQHAIELVSACTGELCNNCLYSDAIGTSLDPGSMKCINNQWVGAIDSPSREVPVGETEGGGTNVVKATAALPQSTDGTLFTVTGGQVEVLALCGEVTTAVQGQSTVCKLKFNPTGTGSDVNLCQDLDLNAAAVGTLLSITGDPNDPMQSGVWVTSALERPFYVGPGVIEMEADASSTGSIGWQLIYRPLEPGASVA